MHNDWILVHTERVEVRKPLFRVEIEAVHWRNRIKESTKKRNKRSPWRRTQPTITCIGLSKKGRILKKKRNLLEGSSHHSFFYLSRSRHSLASREDSTFQLTCFPNQDSRATARLLGSGSSGTTSKSLTMATRTLFGSRFQNAWIAFLSCWYTNLPAVSLPYLPLPPVGLRFYFPR